MPTERIAISGIDLEVLRHGAGTPLLLLHGMETVRPEARFLDLLGREFEIIAPSSPGFGNTKRPPDFDTVYDLVRLYLALIDELPYDRLVLMGLSFGGWLAAEVAVASSHKLAKLILVDPSASSSAAARSATSPTCSTSTRPKCAAAPGTTRRARPPTTT
jgi:pimeloyl-ACP methyl ester carboxylesterase